jgi:hypothetical protein
MGIAITPGARIVLSDEQVSAELTGETVILSMRDGQYYGLDRVGTHVWRLLREPITVRALVESVVASFDVPADRASSDLQALLAELADRGLIDVQAPRAPDDGGDAPGPGSGAR